MIGPRRHLNLQLKLGIQQPWINPQWTISPLEGLLDFGHVPIDSIVVPHFLFLLER